ncbi:MAG: N-acetylmuramoyl-L-alanine amidase [Flavobacteriaceae bacterium]
MEFLLKSALISTALYSFYKIFLQKETFFHSIRFYFIIGIIASVILPFVIIPIYIQYIPMPIPEVYDAVISMPDIEFETTNTIANAQKPINWLVLISNVYLIGVFIFSVKFIKDIASLAYLLYYGSKRKSGKIIFVEASKDLAPFSFFNFIVYNNMQFNKDEMKDIIAHEKVHVKEKHSIDILLIQLLTIIQWFNPFIWLFKKDLQQNLEYIADKTAQEKAETNKKYQYLLLKTSVVNNSFALSNNFFNSHLKKRIMMLQKSQTKKINQVKYLLLIPLIALFLYAFNTKEIITHKNNSNNYSKKVVVIDVSHGGKDAGAEVDGVLEKDIVLDISKRIKSLYKGDAIIKFTREKDEYISLNDRVIEVNKLDPSLLISLHVDNAKNTRINGISASISEENSAFEQSKMIASKLLNNIVNDELKNGGLLKRNFKIIKEANCPAILLEIGFLSNNKNRKYIKSNKGQSEIAQQIVNFINGKNKIEKPKFTFPIHKKDLTKITSAYGMRIHPKTNSKKMHNGIDLASKKGVKVGASAKGKIIFATFDDLYGNLVKIDHENGFQTNYAHMNSITVKVGDVVEANEKIGTVGNTGVSSGDHLHFEILENGSYVNPVLHLNMDNIKSIKGAFINTNKSNTSSRKKSSSKMSVANTDSNLLSNNYNYNYIYKNKPKSNYEYNYKYNYTKPNKVSKKVDSVKTSEKGNVAVVISKNVTDKQLEKCKATFEKAGVVLRFYDIKRDVNNNIKGIRIDGNTKDQNSSSTFSLNQDKSIDDIRIVFLKNKSEILIGRKSFNNYNVKKYTSTHKNSQITSQTLSSHSDNDEERKRSDFDGYEVNDGNPSGFLKYEGETYYYSINKPTQIVCTNESKEGVESKLNEKAISKASKQTHNGLTFYSYGKVIAITFYNKFGDNVDFKLAKKLRKKYEKNKNTK